MGSIRASTLAFALLALIKPVHAAEVLPRPEKPFAGKMGPTADKSVPEWPAQTKAPAGAPNVLLILLDDVGFAVSESFGGPVKTPAITGLAAAGLRYNQFHSVAICSPTRAALLTGRNHHQVGFGNLTEAAAGYPGYNVTWNKKTASIAEVLRQNGFSTAAFGKWHNTPEWEVSPVGPFDRWPTGIGFEYFYGFVWNETSQWEPQLYRNTSPVQAPATPAQGYHFNIDMANDAIHWLRQHNAVAPDRPFFMYYATGAAHAPHHVPKEWIEKYRGQFDQGWDELRRQNFARQKKLGVIPPTAELTARPDGLPAWKGLTPEQKKLFALQVEVYAGFVAQTDHEIGRVLDALKETGQAENTLVLIVVGDNGGSSEGGIEGSDHNMGKTAGGHDTLAQMLPHMEHLGGEHFDNHYAAAWGWATSAPFKWVKQIASHFGGTRNGLVMVWPGHIKAPGGIRNQFSHVNDIVPTILEATGVPTPAEVNGVAQLPMEGSSLVYTIDNPSAPTRHTTQYFEVFANRGIYKDGWFAGARHSIPWELLSGKGGATDNPADDTWELYDVTKDFTQAHDLAAKMPEKLKEMQAAFDAEAKRNNVYPLMPVNVLRPGAPSMLGQRQTFTYFEGVERIPRGVLPWLERSHRLTAKLEVSAGGAEGVIAARGGRYGGWTLYVKDGVLTYESTAIDGAHEKVIATERLPAGSIQIAYEFRADPQPPLKPATAPPPPSGVAQLFVNGKQVGEGRLKRFGGFFFAGLTETFDLGKDAGSPVSADYQAPFAFSGRVKRVDVELK